MTTIPKLFRMVPSLRRLQNYLNTEFTEVLHTTLNPEGPGAIRIHLVPPLQEENELSPSVAIINGTDIVPVNFFWTVILAELIREVNTFDGQALDEDKIRVIMDTVTERVRKIVRFMKKDRIRSDIEKIYTTFRQLAYREPVTEDIVHLNIGEYADLMKAPHRMDVMVSAMTVNGNWHCNQKCVHCYAAGQTCSDEPELSTEDWKKIIDKCRKAGIPQITFTGGEPTMRDDLFELIEHARWFISRLNTNGIRLTEDYCKNLRKAEIDSVQITFYSCDPEIHNALVGAPQFANTAAGIENALKAGLQISINTPLCTLNRDYVKTLEYLHERGVTYVTCSGLITTGNALGENSRDLQLTSEELTLILRDAVSYCHSHDMEIAFTSPGWVDQEIFDELNISTPSCGACLSNMAITPSGNVVPCQSWLSEEALGSMLDDSWESIWNCDRAQSLRGYSAELTGKCPLRRYC